jgi:hypothetical protein
MVPTSQNQRRTASWRAAAVTAPSSRGYQTRVFSRSREPPRPEPRMGYRQRPSSVDRGEASATIPERVYEVWGRSEEVEPSWRSS